jgi:thioredoxin-like negative regulator of GroEL
VIASIQSPLVAIDVTEATFDRDVVDEFVGAVPRSRVEAFFDTLAPSRVDELLEQGDELSLREAAELEPRRADVAVRLGQARLERGAEDEALAALEPQAGDFTADGVASRIRPSRQGVGARDYRRKLATALG